MGVIDRRWAREFLRRRRVPARPPDFDAPRPRLIVPLPDDLLAASAREGEAMVRRAWFTIVD